MTRRTGSDASDGAGGVLEACKRIELAELELAAVSMDINSKKWNAHAASVRALAINP
ncbi:MAG: hypothetical protein NTX50_21680 [Candidatus Sumerlaeota bacterium]|nr:hypothetical protein [Candidatus Sumerlaeota bacterium]